MPSLNPPIVNPIAMILSAAMMLDHLGENDKARKVRDAIAAVVAEGKVRTYDMMRISGGAKSLAQGAASTTQMTDAILAKLGVRLEELQRLPELMKLVWVELAFRPASQPFHR